MPTPTTAPVTLSMMSVTSQARSSRASSSWVYSIATEYAASPASPIGAISQDHRSRRAASEHQQRAAEGTNTARLSKPLAAGEDPEPLGRRTADVPRAGLQPVLGRDDARCAVGRDQGDQADHHDRPDEQAEHDRAEAVPGRRRVGGASARQTKPADRATPTSITPTPPTGNMGHDATGERSKEHSPPGTRGRSRPRVTSTGLVRQRIEPPARWNSETSTIDHLEAPRLELRPHAVGAAGHDHGRADDDRVGAERGQRLLLGQHQRLRDQVEQGGGRGRVERVGADQRPPGVERAEGQVEVVHPGVVIRSPRTRTPRSLARCLSASSSVRGP